MARIDAKWAVPAINAQLAVMIGKAHGGVGLRHVTKKEVVALEIPLPPLPEQKRIAALLNEQMAAVEKARAAAEVQLEAAKALPAAYLREVFESEEAKGWPKKTLLQLCQGKGQYGTSQKASVAAVGLPMLRMMNLDEGLLDWGDLKFIELPAAEEKKYRLAKGDLLFNRTNSAELVGKTAVFDGKRDAVFASYLIRFRLRPTLADPAYVSAFLNSAHGRAFIQANMARAIGQVNISASTMHNMPVPAPPLAVQRNVATRLNKQMAAAERLKQKLEEQLDLINKLPAALLRQAFSGEL